MFKKRLIKSISQKESRQLMTIRSQEKWRPIGPKGASGKALDPQGISKTTFRLTNQMAKIRI